MGSNSGIGQIEEARSVSSLCKLYKHFIYNDNQFKVSMLFFLMTVIGLTPVIDSIFLQNLTDAIELFFDEGKINLEDLLLKWVLLYVVWWEAQNILWRLHDFAYMKTMPKVKADVISKFYAYIQYHSHNFFQSNLAGNITNRIMEGFNSLEMSFAHINEKLYRRSIIVISSMIALYYTHQSVALIFVIWLAVFVGISLYFFRAVNYYSIKLNRNKALIAGKVVDAVSNMLLVRTSSSHKFERKHLRESVDQFADSDRDLQWFLFKLRYGLGLSCTIMMGFIIYYSISLRSDETISTGQCVMIITLCVAVIDSIWDLTQELGDLFEYIGGFNQSLSLFKKYDTKNKDGATDIEVQQPSIRFVDVCFSYHQNTNVFYNKSITIPAFQKVGLAGFSGSGKTTFTRMINRVQEIKSGEIFIDKFNIKDVTLHSLNQNISVISQEPMLFHRTIKENIAYARPNCSDEEIINAAKMAHIHDHIITLPDQYDTICGERGNGLSGGERQRICIARAFLKDAPILIIDEATSSLDLYTEKLIQQSLDQLMQGRTVLIIAHRLNTLKNMDRILVFDKGDIVGDGTHEELMESSSLYKLLWENY